MGFRHENEKSRYSQPDKEFKTPFFFFREKESPSYFRGGDIYLLQSVSKGSGLESVFPE